MEDKIIEQITESFAGLVKPLRAMHADLADVKEGVSNLQVRVTSIEENVAAMISFVKEAKEAQDAIQVVLEGLVTTYEYMHLIGLSTSDPYMVKFGYIFFEELKRLDAIGFIRPVSQMGFNGIKDEHEHDDKEFNLKQYMEITDAGRAYIRIRTRTTTEASEASDRG